MKVANPEGMRDVPSKDVWRAYTFKDNHRVPTPGIVLQKVGNYQTSQPASDHSDFHFAALLVRHDASLPEPSLLIKIQGLIC